MCRNNNNKKKLSLSSRASWIYYTVGRHSIWPSNALSQNGWCTLSVPIQALAHSESSFSKLTVHMCANCTIYVSPSRTPHTMPPIWKVRLEQTLFTCPETWKMHSDVFYINSMFAIQQFIKFLAEQGEAEIKTTCRRMHGKVSPKKGRQITVVILETESLACESSKRPSGPALVFNSNSICKRWQDQQAVRLRQVLRLLGMI